MLRKLSGTVLLAGALFSAGCDNTIDNPTQPTNPPTTTDSFTGTIDRNGASTHTFTVSLSGTITATLTEVTPDPAVKVGFALGTMNAANTCQTVLSKEDAVQGHALIGNATGSGTLCVRVHDPNGTLTAPLTYKLSVEHP